MFNPHPYDDYSAVNRPELSEEIKDSIISGTVASSGYLSDVLIKKVTENPDKEIILALDGYIGAQFDQIVNIISGKLKMGLIELSVIDFSQVYKSPVQLDEELFSYLPEDKEKDPVLLFGKIFKEGFELLLDNQKLDSLIDILQKSKNNKNDKKVTIIYGYGCTIRLLRPFYDLITYLDLTPKEVILRAKKGRFANIGDNVAKPIKTLLRRCYYVDFEVSGHLRWDLLNDDAIDFYCISDNPDNIKLLPRATFNSVMSVLVRYPLRCKPVYIEGIWGGQYVKKIRNLPEDMRNCAWVFDLIPLEVSILVQAGKQLLEFPFFTFVQKEGKALMGDECVKKFGGYFPIRFNYDDTFHSSGNMSIQVHSGHDYNIENFGEHGRQDESYYVIATGHGARTFVGFKEGINPDEFVEKVKISEKEFTPVDYQKYINHIPSQPGIQFLLPAGTIHSSGRNQVVLEIGSLTVGSYTYKMYDYLREDLDGIPRPIHTWHGENVLRKERTTSWVKKNLVQPPGLIRSGDGWAEYIVGEHDLLYFSLRRLEFEKSIEDDTNGKFHVINLVDGEKVIVQSVKDPGLSYKQNYLDVVIVPANVGKYRIINLGNEPVCIHKTMLKDK